MFCPKCGSELKSGNNNCENCGWSYEEITKGETDEIIQESRTIKDISGGNDTAQNETREVTEKDTDTKIKNKKRNRKVIIIIAVIIVAVFIFSRTDTYKYGKAQIQILRGNYEGSISTLATLTTTKAGAMRKYAEVTYARECFMKYYRNDNEYTGSITEDSAMAMEINKFKNAINELKDEEEYNYLPKGLRKQYDYYSEKMDVIDEKYNNVYSYFVAAQKVFLNKVIRNRNETYTLQEQQENIDSSDVAYSWLSANLEIDDELYCEMLGEFMRAVEYEIETSKSYMEESLKRFEMTDTLYLEDPDRIYASYVCEGLDNIATTQNIEDNAMTLIYSAKGEELAYYFDNEDMVN